MDNYIFKKDAALTKEESRAQFVEITEMLGIKHSFNFDEAWEIGEEIRRRKANTEKMKNLTNYIQRTLFTEELERVIGHTRKINENSI